MCPRLQVTDRLFCQCRRLTSLRISPSKSLARKQREELAGEKVFRAGIMAPMLPPTPPCRGERECLDVVSKSKAISFQLSTFLLSERERESESSLNIRDRIFRCREWGKTSIPANWQKKKPTTNCRNNVKPSNK